MADQKNVDLVLGKPAQTAHQLFLARRIEFVLDLAARAYHELRKKEIHGLARPYGARAENEIKRLRRLPEMPANSVCRLTTTAVQTALVILNILLPTRLGMPQQVQTMHGRSPRLAMSPLDRGFPTFGSAWPAVDWV